MRKSARLGSCRNALCLRVLASSHRTFPGSRSPSGQISSSRGNCSLRRLGCQCDVRRWRIAQFATRERDMASPIGMFSPVRKLRKPMETIALANGPGCEMQEPIFQFQARRSGADLATLGFRGSVQGGAGHRSAAKPVLFPLHADCIQDNKCNAFNLGATRNLDRLVIARRSDPFASRHPRLQPAPAHLGDE